jgi:hypothetical protein
MVFMWALPRTNPAFAGVTFAGKVVYRTGDTVFEAGEIDSAFVQQLGELLREICGDRVSHKAPNCGECRYGPGTPKDCGDRMQAAQASEGEMAEF